MHLFLYGNDWMDNGNGTFTSTGGGKYYSGLDLYLIGMIDKAQVKPMLLIDNPLIDATKLPEVGTTISGTSRNITIGDIIAAEGDRIPNASSSQKNFKTAFILLTRPGTFNSDVLPGIETIRNAWAGRFASLTGGKGTIMDVTPSITLAIGSPSNGETISKPSITVKGAVINNTGNETGITVNGIVATIYGTQFIADNISLTEGSNTITVTATDSAGNTATTAITVNAVTTNDYINLTSNIESGILPLEVVLRIGGSFSITNSNLNVTGPAQPEITSSSPEEYKVKMKAEGIYTFTASATDTNNNTYTDTMAIIVMNKNQMDMLLKNKWEGMKTALASGNINGAVINFDSDTQGIYQNQFTALVPILPDIVNELNAIQINAVSIEDKIAEYELLITREGTAFSFPLKFIKDSNGLWKIWAF